LRTSLKTLIVAGAAFCLALGAATPAVAASGGTHATSAKLVGVVHITGSDSATVQAQYRCTGAPEQLHLWVSVKQSADRTADPRLLTEGSGSGLDENGNPSGGYKAAAWEMSHPTTLRCDGKNHVQRFTVNQDEIHQFGLTSGTLAKGKAYVQFCLFDQNYTQQPKSDMEFMNVR
jgi:hypothetical protein